MKGKGIELVWDVNYTSGTSGGLRRPIVASLKDREWLYEEWRRIGVALGLHEEDVIAALIPFSQNSHVGGSRTPLLAFATGCAMSYCPTGKSVFDVAGLSDRAAHYLVKRNPSVIQGMPIFMIRVLKKMNEHNYELPALRMLISGGDSLTYQRRESLLTELRRLTGRDIPILDMYGSTELQLAAVECSPGSGAHLLSQQVRFSVNGSACGTGRLVISTERDTMLPLKSCDTGDYVNLQYGQCPHCGHYGFTLLPFDDGSICKRYDDRLKVKGIIVSIESLTQHISERLGTCLFSLSVRTDADNGDCLTLLLDQDQATTVEVEELVRALKALTDITIPVEFADFSGKMKLPPVSYVSRKEVI